MHLCLKLLCADSKSLLACRTAEMSWEELRGDEKGWSVLGWDENSWEELSWMTCERRWDEMRWAEMRRAHMIRDDMKCGVWSVKCKCEVWRVQREVWGKCLLGIALRRGRAQVMFLDNICATASHKARTHVPGWRTAHANSIDEKSLVVYP